MQECRDIHKLNRLIRLKNFFDKTFDFIQIGNKRNKTRNIILSIT